MGVEKGFFAGLVIAGTMFLGFHFYSALLLLPVGFLIGRWLSKRDDQFVALLIKYLDEGHVYDATPRQTDAKMRPKGWGRGLPT